MASEIKVDTISEKTSANGVTIDGVSLKDSKIATANSVDSDAYVDASIDNAHLADNAVDTAEIADNAVTLAKMAGLARGNLIYGDASGDPAALAVGSANEVLTHDGTDFDWAAAGGAVTALNNATANELVTVGSTTTELDAESGLTYTDGALVIGGTTPSLTIGDAGAEDTKIVFDGNAQDFHIGLDDSADDLVIGKGSTLGTTTAIAIDEDGHVRMPLQSCFSVNKAAGSQADIATDTTIVWGTERVDLNGDFGSNAFTAPVTGTYQFNCVIGSFELDITAVLLEWYILTSNHSYRPMMVSANDGYFTSDTDDVHSFSASIIADMDANDTAHIQYYQTSGADQMNITELSYFSGYLIA